MFPVSALIRCFGTAMSSISALTSASVQCRYQNYDGISAPSCASKSYGRRAVKILFLGPSRKHNPRTGELHSPFDPATLSGQYVHQLTVAISRTIRNCRYSMSNVLDEAYFEGRKEKNPSAGDLVRNWAPFEARLATSRATYVVAFGSNVREAFSTIDENKYDNDLIYQRKSQKIIFAPHPAFVMVYRRRQMTDYVQSLTRLIYRDTALV
jgi:hypothetical protein